MRASGGGGVSRRAAEKINRRRVSSRDAEKTISTFPAASRRRPIGEEFHAEAAETQRRRSRRFPQGRGGNGEGPGEVRSGDGVAGHSLDPKNRTEIERWSDSSHPCSLGVSAQDPGSAPAGPLCVSAFSASLREIPIPSDRVFSAPLPPLRLCVKSRFRPIGSSLRLCRLCVSAFSASLREIGFPPRLRVQSGGEVGSCGHAALGDGSFPPGITGPPRGGLKRRTVGLRTEPTRRNGENKSRIMRHAEYPGMGVVLAPPPSGRSVRPPTAGCEVGGAVNLAPADPEPADPGNNRRQHPPGRRRDDPPPAAGPGAVRQPRAAMAGGTGQTRDLRRLVTGGNAS